MSPGQVTQTNTSSWCDPPRSCAMLDWFMEGCRIVSDWPLGGRGRHLIACATKRREILTSCSPQSQQRHIPEPQTSPGQEDVGHSEEEQQQVVTSGRCHGTAGLPASHPSHCTPGQLQTSLPNKRAHRTSATTQCWHWAVPPQQSPRGVRLPGTAAGERGPERD